ncbi:MAG: hypothetical protein IKF97_04900 [Clostridia bacterium]|nr:hypothetical protein [Clostridia bacterium]
MNKKQKDEIPYCQMEKKYDLFYLKLVKEESMRNLVEHYKKVKEYS